MHKKRIVAGIVLILIAIGITGYAASTVDKTQDVLAQIFAHIGVLISIVIALIFCMMGALLVKHGITWR